MCKIFVGTPVSYQQSVVSFQLSVRYPYRTISVNLRILICSWYVFSLQSRRDDMFIECLFYTYRPYGTKELEATRFL